MPYRTRARPESNRPRPNASRRWSPRGTARASPPRPPQQQGEVAAAPYNGPSFPIGRWSSASRAPILGMQQRPYSWSRRGSRCCLNDQSCPLQASTRCVCVWWRGGRGYNSPCGGLISWIHTNYLLDPHEQSSLICASLNEATIQLFTHPLSLALSKHLFDSAVQVGSLLSGTGYADRLKARGILIEKISDMIVA